MIQGWVDHGLFVRITLSKLYSHNFKFQSLSCPSLILCCILETRTNFMTNRTGWAVPGQRRARWGRPTRSRWGRGCWEPPPSPEPVFYNSHYEVVGLKCDPHQLWHWNILGQQSTPTGDFLGRKNLDRFIDLTVHHIQHAFYEPVWDRRGWSP